MAGVAISRHAEAGDDGQDVPAPQMPRLVGRDRELAILGRAINAGSPALVLVSGEAGIGKSRLVREFIAAPHGPRTRALVAVCPPFHDPCTMGPVVEALRQAVTDISRLALSGLAGALRPLFPEWAAALPPLPEPLADATAERFRLFRALAELLGGMRIEIIVVEDAHHADDGTLEFLVFLAARQPQQVSMLVTFRDDPAPSTMLLRLSSRQPSGRPVVRLPLTPLSVAATAELVSSMLAGTRVTPESAQFLHEHTDGLPLAVEESVRLLYDRADIIWRGGAWGRRQLADLAVPPTFRDAVLERVSRLSDDAAAMLRAAAILAVPAGEATLRALAALPEPSATDGLAIALKAGLICEDRPGLLRFRHALAARAVYDSIPVTRRRDLHRRAGGLLAQLPSPSAAQLARHYREAADIAHWGRHAEEAADLALAVGDEATAETLLCELIIGAKPDAPTLARLVAKVPFTAFGSETRMRAIAAALRAASAAGDAGPRVAVQLRFQLGRVLLYLEDFAGAMSEMAYAVPRMKHDPLTALRGLCALSWPEGTDWPVATHRRWLRRAEAAIARAEASSAEPPTPEARLNFRTVRASALLQLGDELGWAEAAGIPDEASVPAQNWQLAAFHLNIAEDGIIWGRYAESRRRTEIGLRLASRHEFVRLDGMLLVTSARLDWLTGAWGTLADRVAALADDLDIPPLTRLEAALVAGRLSAAAGENDLAAGQLAAVHARSQRHRATYQATESAAALAMLRLAEGDSAQALRLTEDAIGLIARKGAWLWAGGLVQVRVAALAAQDRLRDAAELTGAFGRGSRGRDAPASAAALATCRAIVACRRAGDDGARAGGMTRAAGLFALAAGAWDALPRPYDALLAREQQAQCLLAAGHGAPGLDLLDRVLAGLTELGAAGDAARVTRTLCAHGAAPSRARAGGNRANRGYGDQLSPRELEVVRLIPAGLTNREIAARLCRSPKTVAVQLNSAMRKLGVSSRTAVAVRALETGIVTGGEDGL